MSEHKFKCALCGAESELTQAFRYERGIVWRPAQRYCPRCYEKRMHRNFIVGLLSLALLWLLILLAGLADAEYSYWLSCFQAWLVLPLIILLTVAHELGHTIVARLVGLRVFSVVIGSGRQLLAWRFANINWELHLWPLGGATVLAGPPSRFYRLCIFASVAAGPAVHLLLMLVGLWLQHIQPPDWDQSFFSFSSMLVWLNLVELLGNLYPRTLPQALMPVASDGMQLWKLPSLPEHELEDRYAMYYVLSAEDALKQNDLAAAQHWIDQGVALYPKNSVMQNGQGYVLLHLDKPLQARDAFCSVLDLKQNGPPQLKLLLLNNIAYADVSTGDPLFLDEADRFSLEAFQNAPWVPSFAGTRGAVLVELGRIQEGIALLQDAVTHHTDPASKALNACHLAIAEKRRGDSAQAQRYLEEARLFDPRCRLLSRATRELANGAQDDVDVHG